MEYFQKIVERKFWNGTLDKTIDFIYEEILKVFQKANLSPCSFDLLKLKLKKMKMNMLPKRLYLQLFFCQRASSKLDICQKCAKCFVIEEKHGRLTDNKFTNIYVRKKKMNKSNLCFFVR